MTGAAGSMVSHVHDEVKVIIEKFKKIITVYLCAGTIVFRKWPPGVAAAIILLSSCPGQTADTACRHCRTPPPHLAGVALVTISISQ